MFRSPLRDAPAFPSGSTTVAEEGVCELQSALMALERADEFFARYARKDPTMKQARIGLHHIMTNVVALQLLLDGKETS